MVIGDCKTWGIMWPYTLSEAWSGVNWVDLKAAQGAFGTDFYDIILQNFIPISIDFSPVYHDVTMILV